MHVKRLTTSPCGLSRRRFLQLGLVAAAGGGVASSAGCVQKNPVTGESQLMFMSKQDEIAIDRAQSPHQFSADLGVVQDQSLNNYVDRAGKEVAARSHRPDMPYTFHVVNATYINAYTFPAGSCAITRSMMLELENEAELAALLGHEIGHVNARHTAAQQARQTLAGLAVGGASLALGDSGGQVAGMLGQLGAGALLASYSRDNERQADDLGLNYSVNTGYSPKGMIGLMEVLVDMSRSKPSSVQMLFSTHPMSQERYNTTVQAANTQYANRRSQPVNRDRYMDQTAGLRRIATAINTMQEGDSQMAAKNFSGARSTYSTALRQAPGDYAGLVKLGKAHLAAEDAAGAIAPLRDATNAYPAESQANHHLGVAYLYTDNFDAAFNQFNTYQQELPGNPNTVFLMGYAKEGAGQRQPAAQYYQQYLQQVNSGPLAQHAYNKLVEWGYLS